MTAATPAQRKAAERLRKREAGLQEVRGIYLPHHLHKKIRCESVKLLNGIDQSNRKQLE